MTSSSRDNGDATHLHKLSFSCYHIALCSPPNLLLYPGYHCLNPGYPLLETGYLLFRSGLPIVQIRATTGYHSVLFRPWEIPKTI